MAMRGILVAVVSAVVVGGCGCGHTSHPDGDSDDGPCETGEGCGDRSFCDYLFALVRMEDVPCPDGCPGICGCIVWDMVHCQDGEICMETCVAVHGHDGTEAECRDRPADPMIGMAYDSHWYIPDFGDPYWDVCTPPDTVTALDAPDDPHPDLEDAVDIPTDSDSDDLDDEDDE